jgi:hypothetical protein
VVAPFAACAVLILSSLWWGFSLTIAPAPWTPIQSVVIAAGLLVGGTVSAVGILTDRSPLARKLAYGTLLVTAVVAVLRPSGSGWAVGVGLAVVAGVGLAGPWMREWMRARPTPDSPPAVAAGLMVLLLALPVATALWPGMTDGLALALGSLGAWAIALVYARGGKGALWACRIGLPLLGLAALGFDGPAAITWLLGVGIGTVLAWTPSARVAIRPLVRR